MILGFTFYVLSFNNHCHLLLFAKYYNTYHSIDCCKVQKIKNKIPKCTNDVFPLFLTGLGKVSLLCFGASDFFTIA